MTLLLLAGTGEAKRIASDLAAAGVDAIASLAGATRAPDALDLPTRIGGFGGADGFGDYLDQHRITRVLDATHPFAARISERTARICALRNLPYAAYLRPPWEPEPGDRWIALDQEDQAISHIPKGDTVFLATGRQTLHRFANLTGRRVICRQIDPPDGPFPFAGGDFLIGRPPFSVADEVALFQKLSVDWLVVKNAGGQASRSKLDAARELGIPVLMIERPAPPPGLILTTVAKAVAWAQA